MTEPQLPAAELRAVFGSTDATGVEQLYEPVASASSGITYTYDPALDALVRQPGVAGPIIGERAETIGQGRFNLSAAFSYVHPTSINGDDLDVTILAEDDQTILSTPELAVCRCRPRRALCCLWKEVPAISTLSTPNRRSRRCI